MTGCVPMPQHGGAKRQRESRAMKVSSLFSGIQRALSTSLIMVVVPSAPGSILPVWSAVLEIGATALPSHCSDEVTPRQRRSNACKISRLRDGNIGNNHE